MCYDLIKSTYSAGLDGKLHDGRDMACSALFKEPFARDLLGTLRHGM